MDKRDFNLLISPFLGFRRPRVRKEDKTRTGGGETKIEVGNTLLYCVKRKNRMYVSREKSC